MAFLFRGRVVANKECDIRLFSEVGPDEGETERLVREMNKEADSRAKSDPRKTRTEHLDDIITEVEQAQKAQADRAAAQIMTTKRAQEKLYRLFEHFRTDGGHSPSVAISRAIETAGNAVISETRSAIAAFSRALQDEGVEGFFLSSRKNPQHQTDLLREIGELNKRYGGKPGISGNKEAAKAAKVYQGVISAYRQEQAALGIRVDDLEGRMLRQVWMPDRLREFGTSERFAKEMLPRIDKLRVFDDPNVSDARVYKFLQDFYDERIRGETDPLDLNARLMSKQKDTYAQQQTYSRTIHLKSAEDTFFVMKNFGEGDVASTMAAAVSQVARRTRVAQLFGMNATASVENVLRQAKKSIDLDEAAILQKPSAKVALWHGSPKAMLSIIDGSSDISSDPSLAMVMHTLGNVVRTVWLQGVLLSSLPDLATVSRAGARIGAQGIPSIKNRIDLTFGGLGERSKKLMAGSVETALQYQIGGMTQRFASTGVLPRLANLTQSASNLTMTYGGVNAWTRFSKQTAYVMASSTISRLAREGVAYEELDAGMRGMLRRGGVEAADWQRVLDASDTVVYVDGDHVLLDTDALAQVSPELGRKMRDTMTSFTDDAVPTPGVRERAVMTQGTQAGTIPGVMMRMMFSLMGYPLSFMTRQMAREAELGGAKGISGMAKLGALTLFYGYGSMVLQDINKGRTRDYLSDDPAIQLRNFAEAVARGGFGGIGASVALDAARYGNATEGLLSGAPAALIDDIIGGVFKTGGALLQGEGDKAAAEAAKAIRGLAPFASLPVVKPIVDGFMFYPFLEMTDPQSLSRMERNWRNKTGGEYFIAP